LLSQRSAAQTVPGWYLRQPDAPSQRPSVPHFATPWSAQMLRGSAAPAGTDTHRPFDDGRAQLRQAAAQASAQQTPSTQKLLTHSLEAAQGWPLGLGPQLPFTQTWGLMQSPSPVQRAMQAPSLQR
jgi:hypothetical protein